MLKREAVKSIESQKHQMIAALYANTNWDDERNDRNQRIKELERHFNRAIELVYNPALAEGEKIDWNNPFWAAARRSMQRTVEKRLGEQAAREMSVGEVTGMDAKQMEARQRSRSQIDQLNG